MIYRTENLKHFIISELLVARMDSLISNFGMLQIRISKLFYFHSAVRGDVINQPELFAHVNQVRSILFTSPDGLVIVKISEAIKLAPYLCNGNATVNPKMWQTL